MLELHEQIHAPDSRQLDVEHDGVGPVLAKHGVGIDRAVLQDETRTLVPDDVAPPLVGLRGAMGALDMTLNRLAVALAHEEAQGEDAEAEPEAVSV